MASKSALQSLMVMASIAVMLGVVACSGAGESNSAGASKGADASKGAGASNSAGKQPSRATPAAEPGKAPEPAQHPAGRVTRLPRNSRPWGVAADHKQGLVVVALRKPGRLAVYHPRADKVRVQRGPTARMIDFTGPGGALLVPAEHENTLYTLRVPGLRPSSKVPAGKSPHQAVRVADTTFVSDEFGHAVRALRHGKTVHTFDEPVQPGGVTAAGDRVAAVDVATNTLFVYDARSMKLVDALPAGKGPSHVVPIGGHRVAVCDVRGHAVFTYDIGAQPHRLGRTAVPGRAFWLEADPTTGTIYAALPNTNKIAKLRLRHNGAPQLVSTVPTVRQPISMDLDQVTDTLYVAGHSNGELETIQPSAFGK